MDKNFMQDMLDKALSVLQDSKKDGQPFCPVMAFLKGSVAIVLPMIFTNDVLKRKTLRDVGKYLGVEGIHECLFIDDTYFMMAKNISPDEVAKMKSMEENWDIEKPSMYPPELRREALTLMVINFKDPTQETMWMAEYATSGPNIVISGIEKNSGLKIAGVIKDYVLEGFLVGVATKLGKITPQEFVVHIDAEYPSLTTYLKEHFRR